MEKLDSKLEGLTKIIVDLSARLDSVEGQKAQSSKDSLLSANEGDSILKIDQEDRPKLDSDVESIFGEGKSKTNSIDLDSTVQNPSKPYSMTKQFEREDTESESITVASDMGHSNSTQEITTHPSLIDGSEFSTLKYRIDRLDSDMKELKTFMRKLSGLLENINNTDANLKLIKSFMLELSKKVDVVDKLEVDLGSLKLVANVAAIKTNQLEELVRRLHVCVQSTGKEVEAVKKHLELEDVKGDNPPRLLPTASKSPDCYTSPLTTPPAQTLVPKGGDKALSLTSTTVWNSMITEGFLQGLKERSEFRVSLSQAACQRQAIPPSQSNHPHPVSRYDTVVKPCHYLDAERGVYNTPLKGKYKFNVWLSQFGSGELKIDLVCANEMRQEVMRTTLDGGCFCREKSIDCEAEAEVWLEVVRVRGRACVAGCNFSGTLKVFEMV